MKRIFVAVLIFIALGAGAYAVFRANDNDQKYRTEKVTRGDIEASITATGKVDAVTTVLVGTQVSGTIRNIYVDFNSPVKKGQLIAQIDPSLFEAQVAQARANLLSAKANMDRAVVALADAKRTMSRHKELFAKDLIARSELDAAETAHDTALTQVSAAKGQLSQAEAALQVAETNLRYTRIVSPVNGIVVSRAVDIGQTVAASFQTPTLFTIAQDLTKMEVKASVAEADIGKIQMNQQVEFTVDAFPENPFRGNVSEIRNSPVEEQNVVTYDVIVKVDNPELRLKPGMTANVIVVVASKQDVLKVPNAALRFRPSEKKETAGTREKGQAVWILEKKEPKRVPVKTGISDGIQTELVEGDIIEGQELVVDSLDKPKKQSGASSPRIRF